MVARRDFLRKAAVAGTTAFVVPTIVTVDPADAQALTSPPPEPPGNETQPPSIDLTGSTGTGSSPRTAAGTQPATQATGRQASGRTELPRTGADLDRLGAAGLAATAGGAALVLWSANAKSKPNLATTEPADPEPDT
jgi:hypothetical protein